MPSSTDVSGLPVYYINKFVSRKLEDGSVMAICGIQIGGVWNPLLVTISPVCCAKDAIEYIKATAGNPALEIEPKGERVSH